MTSEEDLSQQSAADTADAADLPSVLAGSFRYRGLPSEVTLSPDDYIACWTNEHGEEVVFIAKRGRVAGIVVHEDLGWKPLDVVGGLVEGYLLTREELAFLSVCMRGSRILRHTPADPDEDIGWEQLFDAVEHEPFTEVSLRAVTGFGVWGGGRSRPARGLGSP